MLFHQGSRNWLNVTKVTNVVLVFVKTTNHAICTLVHNPVLCGNQWQSFLYCGNEQCTWQCNGLFTLLCFFTLCCRGTHFGAFYDFHLRGVYTRKSYNSIAQAEAVMPRQCGSCEYEPLFSLVVLWARSLPTLTNTHGCLCQTVDIFVLSRHGHSLVCLVCYVV